MSIKSAVSPLLGAIIEGPLTGNWQLLKTLEKPAFFIRIVNDTDDYIEIRRDSALVHNYIPRGDILQVNSQANAVKSFTQANFGAGSKFYIRGTGNGRIAFAAYTYYG